MRNFQDTFETRKQSFVSAFLICMTVPLNVLFIYFIQPTQICQIPHANFESASQFSFKFGINLQYHQT